MLSGLTQYVPEATLTVYDNLEFLIRLLLSAALGALVGLERSKRRKEAGIRTHCIIACTSALFMIVSKYAFLDCVTLDGLRGADPARIAAQVVSGISFLGAGVIFKNGNSIRGLTTAAGMCSPGWMKMDRSPFIPILRRLSPFRWLTLATIRRASTINGRCW